MTEVYKEIEQLLVESRNKFRAIVDGIEDDVLSIDNDFRIVAVNKSMARTLNLHPRDLIGHLCHQAVYGFDRPCPDQGRPCPVLRSRKSHRLESEYHELPDSGAGELRYVEVRATPLLGLKDGAAEFILTRRDVTEQRRAELKARAHSLELEGRILVRTRELEEANLQLTRQHAELAEANEQLLLLQSLKEDLTNMVVHDLKGPLSEIQANLEMMSYEPLSELQVEFVEGARLGSNDLLRMITNLVDISRLEENRLVLDLTPFDATREIDLARDRFTPLARLTNLTIATQVPQSLPMVTGDMRLFERILNNLISNALDYTPEYGRVEMAAGFNGQDFLFEVRDTGIGVPEDMRERIFEKFSQGKSGRPKTSTGLGLAFCRMAVEAHGGRIWVESAVGRGSCFKFTLPGQVHSTEPIEEDNERTA